MSSIESWILSRHGAVDGRRRRLVLLRAGVRDDAPRGYGAVAQRPKEALVPDASLLRRVFDLGEGTRYALIGLVDRLVQDRSVFLSSAGTSCPKYRATRPAVQPLLGWASGSDATLRWADSISVLSPGLFCRALQCHDSMGSAKPPRCPNTTRRPEAPSRVLLFGKKNPLLSDPARGDPLHPRTQLSPIAPAVSGAYLT